MIKIAAIGFFLLLISGFLIYKFAYTENKTSNNIFPKLNEVPDTVDDHAKLEVLEKTVGLLQEKVNKDATNPATPVTNTSFNARLIALEVAVQSISTRLDKLEGGTTTTATDTSTTTTTTTSTTPKQPSVYIPIGGGSASSTDWVYQYLPQVVVDTTNFPGYKNMYLESFMLIFQGNGTAYARLLNVTDGTGVTTSEVSTTSENYTLVTSNAFQLPSGKKTYSLQLKSSTGYTSNVSFSRIRVDF